MDNQTVLRPNGINHLALATRDIKGVLTYFNEVLGMPLIALYWMHGLDHMVHGFMKLSDSSSLAFVFGPNITDDVEIGQTHSGNAANGCAKGAMQHLAFNVDSKEDLLAMRDRIRSRNIHCFGPVEHGFCDSIYFAGPENTTLEVCCNTGEDVTQWIDPEVVEYTGISDAELQKLMNPAAYERPAEPVPQPTLDSGSEYCMVYPEDEYAMMVSLTDEALIDATREIDPPTRKAS
jgi:catechol 2,3-dioxygenase-like lactoylglutathione lyase family enzyme